MSKEILERLGLSLPKLPKGSVDIFRLKIAPSLPHPIPLLSIGVASGLQGQNVVVFPAKEGVARGVTLVGTDKLKPGEISPSTKAFLGENGIDLKEPVFVVGAESLGLTVPRQTIRLTVVREKGDIAVRPVRESIKSPESVGFRFEALPIPSVEIAKTEIAKTKREEFPLAPQTPQATESRQDAPRDTKPVVPQVPQVPQVPPPPVKVPPIPSVEIAKTEIAKTKREEFPLAPRTPQATESRQDAPRDTKPVAPEVPPPVPKQTPPGNSPAPAPRIENDRWVFQDRSGFVAELRGDSEGNLQMVKGNVVARMYAQRSPEALKNYLGSKPSEIRFSLVGDAQEALKVPIPPNGVRPFLGMIAKTEETLQASSTSAPDKPREPSPSAYQSDFSK